MTLTHPRMTHSWESHAKGGVAKAIENPPAKVTVDLFGETLVITLDSALTPLGRKPERRWASSS